MAGLVFWGSIAISAWVLLAMIWYRVVKPYFRKEYRVVRTSLVMAEQPEADRLDDQECCVCLVSPKVFRVVATCSHSFCADCFFQIYNAREQHQVECPLCRTPVIAIFKAFEERVP